MINYWEQIVWQKKELPNWVWSNNRNRKTSSSDFSLRSCTLICTFQIKQTANKKNCDIHTMVEYTLIGYRNLTQSCENGLLLYYRFSFLRIKSKNWRQVAWNFRQNVMQNMNLSILYILYSTKTNNGNDIYYFPRLFIIGENTK